MKISTVAVMILCASGAFGQALSNVPPIKGMYISSDGSGNPGTWEPESGTGSNTISYVPPAVGAYCSNNGTGNPGTWVPCPASSSGAVSITSPDGSITFSPSPLTGTGTAIVNRNLTLDTLTFTTDGEGMTFPNSSQIYEDATIGLLLLSPSQVNLATLGGQQEIINTSDGVNTSGALYQFISASNTQSVLEARNSTSASLLRNTTTAVVDATNSIEEQFGTLAISGGVPATFTPSFAIGNVTTTDKNRTVVTAAGALSSPALLVNGAPIATGGSGTTTWPLMLIQPNGTTTTSWNTAGTMFGINSPSGFTGDLFNIQANGAVELKLSSGGTLAGGASDFNLYQTTVVCASAASPAVCTSAASGSVAVPTGGATLVVNTSRITANSQVQLTFDSSLGTRLSVTCNTGILQPTVSARTAGTSFTITMSATVSTNPACISYTIIN